MSKIYFSVSFLFLFLIANTDLLGQQIRFNEVVSSNALHFDEDGDAPDWIELHHIGADVQSLQDWTLTDKKDKPDKWAFPDLEMAPDDYLLIWASGKDRQGQRTTRTLINQGDLFKYTLPTASTSPDWRDLDFDDTAWNEADTGFGYGDNDDATLVPSGTRSIFLRKEFEITEIAEVEAMILDIDYDDAFVAYINGVEIARDNINGSLPGYDIWANTDREATMHQNAPPTRFELNTPANFLQTGKNVLTIQVHNVSAASSDLSLIPFLSAVFTGPSTAGIKPPDFLNFSNTLIHTNFKISASGETLYLFDGGGQLQDSILVEGLLPGVSLGYPLGENDLVFFASPSPGLPNPANGYTEVNDAEIIFSDPGGQVNSLSLTLSGIAPPNVIRYTLDASIPDENSPTYVAPININSNTVVRARVFRDNYLPTPVQSHTYLVQANHSLPIISLVTEPDNFFDEDFGIYVLGNNASDDFPYFGANFWEDWERPIHFSFYERDGNLEYAFDAGCKIFGGWSRGQEQRSLSLFARGGYGQKELDYPFFPDLDYQTFQALVLRNSGNDWMNTNLRDVTLTGLMKGSGLEKQSFRHAVTYLNGTYWGFYSIREKVNEHFIASKTGYDVEDLDILEANSLTVYGDNQEYLDLLNFIRQNSMSNTANYNLVAEQIDIENYAHYQVAQIYFNNWDWPGNNIKYWKAKGGKWRWILYDTDFGFGLWDSNQYLDNTLSFALNANGPNWPNPPWATFLFRRMIQNTSFRNDFVNRFADELNTRFLPENFNVHIDSISANLAVEMSKHYNRWGGNLNYQKEQVQNMKRFAALRPREVKRHLLSQFGLPNYHALTIQNNDPSEGYVDLNWLTLKENKWTGDYFQGVPVKIVAVPYPGYVFSHWEGDSNASADSIAFNIKKASTLIPVFRLANSIDQGILINEINYQSKSDFDTGDWIELHNSNTSAFTLSDWVFTASDPNQQYVFPKGTFIPGNGYLVLAADLDKFQTFYPDMKNVIGEFDFDLSAQGDSLRLLDETARVNDLVAYLPNAPWPYLANGSGPSMELKMPNLNNSLPQNWAILHDFGSPGRSNLYKDTIVLVFTGNTIESLKLFPNPFTDQINLTFGVQTSTSIKASLYNANGMLVHEFYDDQIAPGFYHWKSNLEHLSRGAYLLEFKEGEEQAVFKWIKL